MKERPILFSAPMIKALLAGAKTQTRRIITPQPEHLQRHEWKGKVLYDAEHRTWWWKHHSFENLIDFEDGRRELAKLCPHGSVGDRLWCKETYQPIWSGDRRPSSMSSPDGWALNYVATGGYQEYRDEEHGLTTRCKPAIFMPRWASRITLDITNVRVEHLQEITEEDAKAEGAAHRIAPGGDLAGAFDVITRDIGYRAHFADLWRSINGAESWDANPWVFAISFERVEQARSAA